MSDLRHAFRRLARTPIFALAASLTLSLAIGANATVFALLRGVVLNPLPYPDSNRLIELDHSSTVLRLSSGIGLTSGLYYQYARAGTLQGLAIHRSVAATLVRDGRPERIAIVRTTSDFAGVLQVGPLVGRWFSDEESAPGGRAVAVLSYGLWVRRFGANPAVVDSSVTLDGEPTQIVGVMPPSFAFPDPGTEAWVPARVSRAMGFAVPFGYRGVARLKPGVGIEAARAEMNTLIADLPNVYPGDRAVEGNVGRGGLASAAVPLKEATIGSVGSGLWVLLTAMALLLLVACANIGNLVLVRAEGRQREVTVRRALGATFGDIVRFFLSESLLLASAGAVGGLGSASWALQALVAAGPSSLPRLHEVRNDAITVAFTVAISLVACLAFGLIPLLRSLTFGSGLRDAGRGTTAPPGQHRTRHVLMAGQVALALALLVGAALMVRSYDRLRAVDLGFTPGSALTFRVGLPTRDYPTRAAAVAAHRAILERLEREPGVEAVSASTGLPLADACFGNSILVRGQNLLDGTTSPVARLCAASEGYVRAMRMRLVRGRDLERADIDGARTNVLVNEAFVQRVLRGADPIGKQLRSNAPPPPSARAAADGTFEWEGGPPWLTIVGVVSNTPFETLTERAPLSVVYMPLSIAGGPDIPSSALLGPATSAATYVVRSTVPTATITAMVQRAVQAVDRSLAVAQVMTLQRLVDRASAQMALTMALLVIAATGALAIGVVGIYGVIAYAVSQRRGEIGVRLALGAAPGDVVAMIVKQGLGVALAGVAAGLALAAAASGVLTSLLFGVNPHDPAVFAGVGALLAAVALVACWLPARAAARVSPTEALRAE